MGGSGVDNGGGASPRGDHSFHIADYSVFGVTLFVSLGIGVYQALSGGKQRTISEYLVGGRRMTVLPVAISLMVSFESSIMMLGMPGEAYVYGIQYIIGSLGYMCAQLISVYLVVPMVHPLKLTSAYEYLEMRFKSPVVRKVGSLLGIINYVWYMGIVLFGPATALEAVTGFNQWSSIFLVAIAAIIYTSIGGIKAVIWTDVFQAAIMFAGMFAVLIQGTIEVGGPNEVWRRANLGGRNNLFVFDPDPTVRHTFWNLFFGKALRGMSLIFNQSSIQRITSTRTKKEAMAVMFFVSPGFLVTFTLAIMEGVVAYSYYDYHQCDPFASKQIKNPNQVIPYMVVDIFRNLPGMPGLYLAALFSASLSTISSGLSSISALTWKDFVQPVFPHLSEFKATLVAKVSVVVFGFLACGVSLLASMIGGPLTQIGNSLLASFSGPLAGLFMLGSLFSIANAKGALAGCLVSFVLTMWISMGANFSPHRRKTPWLPPASTDQCPGFFNSSLLNVTDSPYMNTTSLHTTTLGMEEAQSEPEGINRLYLLSYVWFSAVAIIAVIVVGLIVSYLTAREEEKPDPRHLVPLRKLLLQLLPRCVRSQLCCNCEEDEEEELKQPVDTENILDTEIIIETQEAKPLFVSNGVPVKSETTTPVTTSDLRQKADTSDTTTPLLGSEPGLIVRDDQKQPSNGIVINVQSDGVQKTESEVTDGGNLENTVTVDNEESEVTEGGNLENTLTADNEEMPNTDNVDDKQPRNGIVINVQSDGVSKTESTDEVTENDNLETKVTADNEQDVVVLSGEVPETDNDGEEDLTNDTMTKALSEENVMKGC